jgi:hypothetical protein
MQAKQHIRAYAITRLIERADFSYQEINVLLMYWNALDLVPALYHMNKISHCDRICSLVAPLPRCTSPSFKAQSFELDLVDFVFQPSPNPTKIAIPCALHWSSFLGFCLTSSNFYIWELLVLTAGSRAVSLSRKILANSIAHASP